LGEVAAFNFGDFPEDSNGIGGRSRSAISTNLPDVAGLKARVEWRTYKRLAFADISIKFCPLRSTPSVAFGRVAQLQAIAAAMVARVWISGIVSN
jgi:hypothetical protein